MVAEQKRTGHEKRSSERDKMEAQIRIPQKKSAVGYPDVAVGGRREGLDTACDTKLAPQGGRHDQPAKNDGAADGDEKTEGWRHPEKETKRFEARGTREAHE